jgi:hypothetical protein
LVKTFAIAGAALALVGGSAVKIKVTLSAPTHQPKIDVHWPYAVHLTRGGKPLTGRITVQIVDPIGGVHSVQFGSTTIDVTRFRFRGVFRDYVIWPPESRGIPLKLRVTVVRSGFRKVISYAVTPQ